MSRNRPTASEFLSSPYDPGLEREFFGRIVLPNGIIKTTAERRLDELNALALPHIQRLPSPVRILDVAASSGISSAEWHEQLTASGIRFRLTATDLTVNAFHLKLGPAEALLDKEHDFIHLSFAGRGMPPKAGWPRGIVTTTLKMYLSMVMAMGAKPRKSVRLVTKRISDGMFDLIEDDLLNGAGNNPTYDVIRAANILNLGYFSEHDLRRMIANLKARLSEDGLLIVCRTQVDGSNHGTVFRFHDGCFTPLTRIGDGSEVEHLL